MIHLVSFQDGLMGVYKEGKLVRQLENPSPDYIDGYVSSVYDTQPGIVVMGQRSELKIGPVSKLPENLDDVSNHYLCATVLK